MVAKETNPVAIIFGVTGLVGRQLAKILISTQTWKVYGIARKPDSISPINHPNYHFISCDLLNSSQTKHKLSLLHDVTHIFWVTWATQHPLDTPDCYDFNKQMLLNSLETILPKAKSLQHFSLQTGMKHYTELNGNLFDKKHFRCYDEQSPRVDSRYNFYYALEDVLKEKLSKAGKVAWSVHRPGLLIGSSSRTLFNFMGSLCVYGVLCKHLNLPFVFGGTKECWEEFYIDGSDSQLVAEQHIWAATNIEVSSSDGQALNAINGLSFTWKAIWPTIAKKFGLQVSEDMFSEEFRFDSVMSDKKDVWGEIVVMEGLMETKMEDLANWGFMDSLFRCPIKLLGSRLKADRLGFTKKIDMLDSILYWIDYMKDANYIP